MKSFKAHCGASLFLFSAFLTILCVTLTILYWKPPTLARLANVGYLRASLPLVFLIGSALFIVRGYVVTPDQLRIRRLLWSARISLDGLQSVEYRPDALRKAVRTFGNGGFFSYSGRYYSRDLGSLRVFATDTRRTVILRFSNRTIVLSPEHPEDFVTEISSKISPPVQPDSAT